MAKVKKSNNKNNLPQKLKSFIERGIHGVSDSDIMSLVEEYNNPALYSPLSQTDVSVLSYYKDIPAMLKDPIIFSALSYLMETAFQPTQNQDIFWVTSKYPQVQALLDEFHANINAQDLILVVAYNLLLWGNLPSKNHFNEDNELERVSLIPDFTKVNPIVVSGKTLGYMVDNEFCYAYQYNYSQLKFYKNLGGNSRTSYVTFSTSTDNFSDELENEFVLAPSYLSTSSKAWRNISIIEDALLLNRMDQSNYYRIFSVDVGTSVYSKPAVKVLNYYRNLFKKVRRVSYDSNGISARGQGNEFEVIIPKNGNQGVDVKDVGGNVNVEALQDLDTQYNRLFSSLRIQPSMIGFKSNATNTLGDSPETVWDDRFMRLCRSVVFSTLDFFKQIDLIYLRSRGYDVTPNDWTYGTVVTSLIDEAEKTKNLNTSLDNVSKLLEQLTKLDVKDINKKYLVKSLLGSTLESLGVDSAKLFESSEPEVSALQANYVSESITDTYRVFSSVGVFSSEQTQQIIDSIAQGKEVSTIHSNVVYKGQVTLSKLLNNNEVLPGHLEVDLSSHVKVLNKTSEEVNDDFAEIPVSNFIYSKISFPIAIPNDIKLTIDDINQASVKAIEKAYRSSNGELVLTSASDLATYISMYQSGLTQCVISNFKEV